MFTPVEKAKATCFRKSKRQRCYKIERSRIIPEGEATEEAKKRKVTHISERPSDRGSKKEKGHAFSRKAKRRKRQKRERSRIFPEGQATEGAKKKKVTHISERLSDGGAIKEKGHACFRKARRQRGQKIERSRMCRRGQPRAV